VVTTTLEAQDLLKEYPVELTGPAHLHDVYETVDAHISRTQEEHAEMITGVDAGAVDQEEEALLHVYVLGAVPPEKARERMSLALGRISDEHSMTIARQGGERAVGANEPGEE
jgi:hypothetical protein